MSGNRPPRTIIRGLDFAITVDADDRVIRDATLVTTGRFNPQMYGPSIYPQLSEEVLATQSRPGDGWDLVERARSTTGLKGYVTNVDVDQPVKTIVVTSAVSGEGKSSTACGLAVLFAASALRSASARTSSATTAKPRPASPAPRSPRSPRTVLHRPPAAP